MKADKKQTPQPTKSPNNSNLNSLEMRAKKAGIPLLHVLDAKKFSGVLAARRERFSNATKKTEQKAPKENDKK